MASQLQDKPTTGKCQVFLHAIKRLFHRDEPLKKPVCALIWTGRLYYCGHLKGTVCDDMERYAWCNGHNKVIFEGRF